MTTLVTLATLKDMSIINFAIMLQPLSVCARCEDEEATPYRNVFYSFAIKLRKDCLQFHMSGNNNVGKHKITVALD